MPSHYEMASEVEAEDDLVFPEPKATKQYKKKISPSGYDFPEPHVTKQYSQPIGPEPRGSIFQRIAEVAAPGMVGEAKALGKKGVRKIVGGAIVTGVTNTGQRVGSLVAQPQAPPVWLMDSTRGKGGRRKQRSVQIPGTDLPPWLFGGGMPWDRPPQKSDVERVIVTRVHADGTRTTTTRIPRGTGRRGSATPDWINF